MFSLTKMPSTASVLSAYTTFTATTMLARTVLTEVQTMIGQLIPQRLQEKVLSKLGGIFGKFSDQLTIFIDEYNGVAINEIYQSSEIYLSTRITPSVEQLKVSQSAEEKSLLVTVNKGQKIIDTFEGIQLTWEFICIETQKPSHGWNNVSETRERKSIQLSFHKRYKEKVLSTYLPYIAERAKAIKESKKVVKLHSITDYQGSWDSINLDHPSTFDTLAMDPVLKKELMDDLDRFVERREFYRRVGKAWKRGYLLYGPPGTGKSSLIAAMANYLKFDIYDLELTTVRSNSELRYLLVSTGNRSILVIEDIDCSTDLKNRQSGVCNDNDSNLTLSGLLNFVDGLWSSCGNERIIVFTTNHKERLDPALLRPGRMDKHIHMSFLTPCAFKTLSFNYLNIESHSLFPQIEELIKEVEVTPAEVAEELMKNTEDADVALEGLIEFLEKKKENMKCKVEEELKQVKEQEKESEKVEKEGDKKRKGVNKNKKMAKTKRARNRR
ncbi:AAA-ATPase At3g50940-like [Pistacia vera]|uniref:AAA-ATPase At3g50940-like n=1 Tax=Pistacia vera TaxID=55513 RepID=UPI001263985B|nr:AAA-ATPase At3g50940-like [Pistacia vera]